MNEKQAIEKGYEYVGSWSTNKEEVKTKIKHYKEEFPKAKFVMVYEKNSGLSRSGDDSGYSVYGDKKYFTYEQIKITKFRVETHTERIENITKEYQRKLKEELENYEKDIRTIKECEEILNRK